MKEQVTAGRKTALNEASQGKAKPKLWTPEDLASYLGMQISWIYKRTRKNGPETIPHIKLGKYVRFDPESAVFQKWLASHAKASGELTTASNAHTFPSTEKTGHIN